MEKILHRIEYGQGEQGDSDLILNIAATSWATRSARSVMLRHGRRRHSYENFAANLKRTSQKNDAR